MKNEGASSFLPRAAAVAFEKAVAQSPVVVLTGARQTGKTTLVQSMPALAGHRYLSLDDFESKAQADHDPKSMLRDSPRMILDEVQRSPELLSAVKLAVDADRPRIPGRFILTGSANLLLMHQVSESLAGRALFVTLRPLTRFERHGRGRTGTRGRRGGR